ncbi:hypothetical protein QCA50_003813 [Cerrena zonata]|uniref:Uncharacterized protein n=1 Tax=Cerrena zonata TaxID=2478898 RepID=A0AAW0GK52_9APHY
MCLSIIPSALVGFAVVFRPPSQSWRAQGSPFPPHPLAHPFFSSKPPELTSPNKTSYFPYPSTPLH